jgi:hypothetical protein
MSIVMHTTAKIILAAIAVIAGATSVLFFLGGYAVAIYACVITAAHVVILGIPVFLLLRWSGNLTGLSLAATGFICGCVPVGIWYFTSAYRERGAPLFRELGSLVWIGLIGLLCATVFWFVWNLLSVKQDRYPWISKPKVSGSVTGVKD